ncbi:MAG: hypothetical protein MUE78_10480 [Ilumatobacteraceae bacterium]|nr:hypothetical protein [Ilumatobacteraceae bacterium]
MPLSPELRRVVDTHQAATITAAVVTASTVGAAWDAYGGLTDTASAQFTAAATPVVAAAQAQAVGLAAVYVATYVSVIEGTAVPPPELDTPAIVAGLRAGTDPVDVYHRSVVAARVAVADGATYTDAIRRARDRATQTADTDVMLASRAGTSRAMEAFEQIVGYRRVPDADACTFCLLASTQRYNVRDLMPMHPRCHCTVAPIVGTADPGRVIDGDLLDMIRSVDPVAGTRGEARRRARARVERHGELGPVLVPAGTRFTGPTP